MLSRVRSWFRRRETSRRRSIFRFEAGGVARAADPLEVIRILEAEGGTDWPALLSTVERLCRRPSDQEARLLKTEADWAARTKKRSEATEKLVSMIRKAFQLEPLDQQGRGVPSLEAIGILTAFVSFTGDLAEQARPFC